MKWFATPSHSFRLGMRLKAWSILGAAGMISAPVAASNAQYALGTATDVCGGSSFVFCLAISAVEGTGANAGTLFLTIVNQGLHGSDASPYGSLVFTAMGFDGATPTSFSSSPGTSFVASNDINKLSNFGPGPWVGVTASNPGPKNGLLFGESITFAFANTTAATFAASDFAIHAQAGPGGCSSKLKLDLSQSAPSNGGDFIDAECGGLPVTATPEPASLALMATGLSGLGAFVKRRRRKA